MRRSFVYPKTSSTVPRMPFSRTSPLNTLSNQGPYGRFGYSDLLLFSPDGNVIYTVSHRIDLGTNLTTGVLVHSNLARAFQAARDADRTGYHIRVDFERYLLARTAAAAFIAAPI